MAKDRRGPMVDSQAPAPAQAKASPYVQYVGMSDNRGITVEDFEQHGVKHKSLWWTKRNNWKVSMDDISDEAYQIAIEMDPQLVLVEPDKETPSGNGS
jgi:hypothetical protein